MKTDNQQPEKGIVIQNIVIRPVQRITQDIQNWRNAMQAAEGIIQYRTSLYDLYADVVLDSVLSTTMEKRILNVTKHTLLFINADGTKNEEISKLASLYKMHELRKELMLQKFWGICVIELMRVNNKFDFFRIDRKHIKPRAGKITYEQNGEDGIYYREAPYNKFVLEIGRYDDLGLLLNAAPYVIYKRGAFGNWANFTQLFGMPFREARYNGFNDATRKQLEIALESMGSAGYGIFPEETSITFHSAQNPQANGELYNLLRMACNEEIAVCILGQTDTTLPSPGKLGHGESAHVATQNDIENNDCVDELSVFNTKVLPILRNLGYNTGEGKFIHEQPGKRIDAVGLAKAFATLKNDVGLVFDDDYLYTTFGIRKPKNYEELKKAMK